MTDTPRPVNPLVAAAIEDAQRKTLARPKALSRAEIESEKARCKADIIYFINTYCQISDSVTGTWMPFNLWPDQETAILSVLGHKYSVFLKARQMGISWCVVVAIPLWKMLFHPIAKVLLFSQRDEEAAAMLARIKGTANLPGMYQRLPDWMQIPIMKSNDHEFVLANESSVNALTATAGGRSHSATYVAIDEADFVEDTASLVKAAKPTIDAGQGQMVMLSTANEKTPNSYFQRLFKGAYKNPGESDWNALFLSWRSRPDRTQAWYDKTVQSAILLEGSVDAVYKEYPETVDQALAARSTDKRFPPFWISYFSHELRGLPFVANAPVLPGLIIYREVEFGHNYGMGADPAEGMQSSDDSVITVIDADSREEVAVLAGKIEPSTLADYAAEVALYYNNSPILPERNNHGHLFINHMRETHPAISIRHHTDGKPGWHTSKQSKVWLYTHAVKIMQGMIDLTHPEDEHGHRPAIDADNLPKIIHSPYTIAQLASIETRDEEHEAPAAPEGFHDDYATGWVLAQMCVMVASTSMMQVPYTGLYGRGRTPMFPSPSTVRPMMTAPQPPPTMSEHERIIRERYKR